jgi:hypothetical protein
VKTGQSLSRNTELIFRSYVHGVMDGEAMDEFEAGLFKIETFAIH